MANNQAASRTIYFKGEATAERIQRLADSIGVATSHIVSATMEAVIEQLEKKAPKEREFNLNCTIKL